MPWSRHFWTTLISVVPVRCTGDRRRGLETIYTRTANASVDFSAVGCDFRVIIFVVVGFWKITHFQWEIQDPIYWRYLPYIRPIFQGYVRGYPPKMWPTIWYTYRHVLDPGIPIDITRCFVLCSIQWWIWGSERAKELWGASYSQEKMGSPLELQRVSQAHFIIFVEENHWSSWIIRMIMNESMNECWMFVDRRLVSDVLTDVRCVEIWWSTHGITDSWRESAETMGDGAPIWRLKP